jgi:ABC-type phosphate transport system substrate-binding protein
MIRRMSMKIIKKTGIAAIILTLALSIFISASPASAEVIVIVNKEVPSSSLDKASLSDMYLGKKTLWDKNTKVTLSVLKGGAVHDQFMQNFVGKTAAQFQSYWNKLLFTGAGTPPTAFKTEKEIVDFVSKTRGAVGYIDSATPHDAVKVLSVK